MSQPATALRAAELLSAVLTADGQLDTKRLRDRPTTDRLLEQMSMYRRENVFACCDPPVCLLRLFPFSDAADRSCSYPNYMAH